MGHSNYRNPIGLVILDVTDYGQLRESTDYIGYIPRKGECIAIGKKDYKIVEIYMDWNDSLNRIDCITLIAKEL